MNFFSQGTKTMYRLWAKAIKNNKIINSVDVGNNENITQEQKLKKCLSEIFYKLDISAPVWIQKHDKEFSEFKKIIFFKDDFVDEVNFDKLEIDLIDDGIRVNK